MAGTTGIPAIDDCATVWQVNWVQVAWPPAVEFTELLTRGGERLFPETHLMDATGPGPRVRMNEESALALAEVSTKEEFLDNHAAGKHTFPAMATLKILREVNTKASGGSHLADPQSQGATQSQVADEEQKYVNFTIVKASDQPLHEAPMNTLLELIPLMPQIANDTACILAAPLNVVKACTHYAFQVRMPNGVVMPCQKIVTLVKSTKKSTLLQYGKAYKIVTRDVEDVLATDAPPLFRVST